MDTANRVCKVCLKPKPLASFSTFTNKGQKPSKRHTCSSCRTDRVRQITSSSPKRYLQSWLSRGSSSRGQQREVDLKIEDLLQCWHEQSGRCAVTNMAMTYSPKSLKLGTGLNVSIDRINSDQGYTPKNIRLVCHRVNVMRNTGDDAELQWWCRQIMQGLTNE